MDHSLEAHVDLSAADYFCHIGWIVRFEESNLQALILEVSLGLGKVKRSMVWSCVPWNVK